MGNLKGIERLQQNQPRKSARDAPKNKAPISPAFSPVCGPTACAGSMLLPELSLPPAHRAAMQCLKPAASHLAAGRHLAEATNTAVAGQPPSLFSKPHPALALGRPAGCGHAGKTWPSGACPACRARPMAAKAGAPLGAGFAHWATPLDDLTVATGVFGQILHHAARPWDGGGAGGEAGGARLRLGAEQAARGYCC
jgi:hypothetical protein